MVAHGNMSYKTSELSYLWLKFPNSFCAPGCPEEQMTLFCAQYEGKIYCHLHVTPTENWVLGNDCNR